jgi:hypothetical protein
MSEILRTGSDWFDKYITSAVKKHMVIPAIK